MQTLKVKPLELETRRITAGYSRLELAKEAGYSEKAGKTNLNIRMKELERGRRKITPKFAKRFAKILGCKLEDITKQEGE